ncbi:MAG: hypothetical protein K8R06_00885, partial [Methanosarcinales archaeon]|nr:hypothetical protein [Methanosarcinales archaeon]
MNRIGSFVLGLLLIGLLLNTALADAPIFDSKDPSINPSSDQGETQEFSVETNQTMDFIWYINNIQDETTSSDNTSSYSNNTAPVGDHNVTVVATNGNGTISTNWTWKVEGLPEPSITSRVPDSDTVETNNGSSQTFKIDFDQTVNVTWYLDGSPMQNETDKTTSSSFSDSSPEGEYNVTVEIENSYGADSKIWTWSVIPILPPSITRDPTSNPDSNLDQDQEFTVTIDQPVNITWLMNGTEIHNESLKTSSTYSNSSMPIGTYNITVNIENVNGTNTTTWMWSVVPIPVVISDQIPSSSTPSTVVDETITFSIKIDQSCKVIWYIDGDDKQTNTSPVTSASFTTSKDSPGTYIVKAIATNNTTSASDNHEWTWKVNPKTYTSGNRIWVDDPDMYDNETYTWDPQSFSGFYYDLDNDIGKETLTFKNIDGSLKSGEIIYETSPISIDFEQDIWDTYEVIGFMADRYFAGYTDNTTFASSDESLLDERQLSKVLLDTDKKYNLRSGSSLELEEGYELRIAEFGSGGDAVMVALFKNGEKVTEDIVEQDDTFVYEKDLGGARDMPIIAIYFDNVFVGTETSTIVIEGIFQVSDDYIDVSTGDEFGLMEIKSASSSGITMRNDDSVSLGEGDDFNLMGKINIIVADHSTLRFAPYVDMSEPGTYELRGTVTNETTFKWTPFNFEGLLYDIDTGDGDETLNIELSGRTVNDDKLTYTTKPISMKFEHSGDDWNTFQSIGFMGYTYFAGYLDESSFISSDRSLIKEGKLSKILI